MLYNVQTAFYHGGDFTRENFKSVIETTNKCLKAVLTKWRDLHVLLQGLNIHAVEDHLVYLMILWNGIGCFLEDFVEQSYQTGKLEEKRSGHMGD